MKILVTGHSGFIGQNIVKYLSSRGHLIVGVSRGPCQKSACDIQISCDLGDMQSCELLLSNKNLSSIDIIIHTSSVLADSENIKSLTLLYDNLKITEGIVKLCQSLKPKSLVNLSTFAVYPNVDGDFSEESKTSVGTNPEGIYGLSKLCSENIFDFYLSPLLNVVHLRLGQVYGEGMRSDRIYSIFLDELKHFNRITVWGNGQRISNFIPVSILMESIQFFVNYQLSGVYNVGHYNISYKDMAQMIINQYGNIRSEIILVPEGSQSRFTLNCEKVRLMIEKSHSKLI